jgi:hypothetical protein
LEKQRLFALRALIGLSVEKQCVSCDVGIGFINMAFFEKKIFPLTPY